MNVVNNNYIVKYYVLYFTHTVRAIKCHVRPSHRCTGDMPVWWSHWPGAGPRSTQSCHDRYRKFDKLRSTVYNQIITYTISVLLRVFSNNQLHCTPVFTSSPSCSHGSLIFALAVTFVVQSLQSRICYCRVQPRVFCLEVSALCWSSKVLNRTRCTFVFIAGRGYEKSMINGFLDGDLCETREWLFLTYRYADFLKFLDLFSVLDYWCTNLSIPFSPVFAIKFRW